MTASCPGLAKDSDIWVLPPVERTRIRHQTGLHRSGIVYGCQTHRRKTQLLSTKPKSIGPELSSYAYRGWRR